MTLTCRTLEATTFKMLVFCGIQHTRGMLADLHELRNKYSGSSSGVECLNACELAL